MAKKTKEGPNKSDSIRAYLAQNPKAGPTEIAQALKADGVEVSVALVSAIKAKNKPKRGRKPGVKGKPGPKTRSGDTGITLELLLAAKKLADQLGGIDKAKQAIDILARIS